MSNDEREALIQMLHHRRSQWHVYGSGQNASLADEILETLGHSVVPEPSAEPTKNTRYRWAGGKPPSEDRKQQREPSDAQVEFPFTHEGVTLEQDDGGVWVNLDASEFTTGEHRPYWIGPRALAALRAAGVTS